MLKLAIIIGSTRPGRVGEAVGRWVHQIAQQRGDAEFELVDIKDFNLPLLDEPIPPSQGKYSKEHTKKWAAKIASFDGYVFVTPEYNHGISRCAEERDRFPLRRVEQQGGRVRRLRQRGRGTRGGAPAAGHGRGAGRDRAQPGHAVAARRLRELQRLQAEGVPREDARPGVRPGDRLGRRASAAAGEARLTTSSCNHGGYEAEHA